MVGGQTGTVGVRGPLIVVVVDPDIDITNMNDVLWAMMTRCDPARDITDHRPRLVRPLDPAIHPDERGFNSRLLIDATRPWEWKDRFAAPVVTAGHGARGARALGLDPRPEPHPIRRECLA